MTRETAIPWILGIPENTWDLIAASMELHLGRLACRLARRHPQMAGFYTRCGRQALEKGRSALRGHDEWVKSKQGAMS